MSLFDDSRQLPFDCFNGVHVAQMNNKFCYTQHCSKRCTLQSVLCARGVCAILPTTSVCKQQTNLMCYKYKRIELSAKTTEQNSASLVFNAIYWCCVEFSLTFAISFLRYWLEPTESRRQSLHKKQQNREQRN